jgi:hypothetical protein
MHPMPRGLLTFLGGSVSRAAGTAMVVGIFVAVYGVVPWELIARFVGDPPAWFMSGWFRLSGLIVGLALLVAAVTYNIWDRRQVAVDSLAEDISWAIANLLNRKPPPRTDAEIDQLQTDYDAWCGRVSEKLGNRAFFTRADQLHFARSHLEPA